MLWYNNSVTNTQGSVNITAGGEVTGDPVFDTDGYHLTAGSAAVDAVLTPALVDDIDRETRSGSHDLGADEFVVGLTVSKYAVPSSVEAGNPMTFTILVTNTASVVAIHANIFDMLPDHVTASGVQNFYPTIAAGGTWRKDIIATADMDDMGIQTNTVLVTSDEGASGSAQAPVTIFMHPIVGLAAVNDSPTSLGSETTLTATVGQGTNPGYIWSPGDGSPQKSGQVVNHQYTSPGVYKAVVTASNAANSLQASTIVTVDRARPRSSGKVGKSPHPGVKSCLASR